MLEVVFYWKRDEKVVRLIHLLELYKLEAEGLVSMSKLMEESVCSKPIERQTVYTFVMVFFEETYIAIINHSEIRNVNGGEHTSAFSHLRFNWSF